MFGGVCVCVEGWGIENNCLLKTSFSSKHVNEVMLWKTGQSGSVLSQTMSFGVSYGAAASVPRWTLANCQIKPLGPLAVLEGPSEVLSTALSPSGFLASLGIFHTCLQQSFTVLQQRGFWDGTCSTSWMVGRRAAAVHSRGDRHGNIRHLNMCHESYKSSQNFNWKKTKANNKHNPPTPTQLPLQQGHSSWFVYVRDTF